MGVNVWRCGDSHCMEVVPEDRIYCEEHRAEHGVVGYETRISFDITYSRETVALHLFDKEGMHRGHFGRRAIADEHLPQELQDQIREFVMAKEEAK